MKARRIAITVLSFIGLVLLGKTHFAQANGGASLTLIGPVVTGAPMSFSATAAPNSSVRIVVVSAAFEAVSATRSAQISFGCYSGTPTAVATFDGTTDSSGKVGPVVVWTAAAPGSYTALLLQGPCASVGAGRTTEAVSDQRILAEQGFTDPSSVPALSVWGLAALGLALSVAGWTFLSHTRS